jgi:hypothetical protein
VLLLLLLLLLHAQQQLYIINNPLQSLQQSSPPHLGHVLRQWLLGVQALQALPELIIISLELQARAGQVRAQCMCCSSGSQSMSTPNHTLLYVAGGCPPLQHAMLGRLP